MRGLINYIPKDFDDFCGRNTFSPYTVIITTGGDNVTIMLS